jgi:hypothetical protein
MYHIMFVQVRPPYHLTRFLAFGVVTSHRTLTDIGTQG